MRSEFTKHFICNYFIRGCIKIHERATVFSKFFQGLHLRHSLNKGTVKDELGMEGEERLEEEGQGRGRNGGSKMDKLAPVSKFLKSPLTVAVFHSGIRTGS